MGLIAPVAFALATVLAGSAPPTAAIEDFDKDGVADLDDDCPTDPGDPKAKGCPADAKPEPPPAAKDPPKVEVKGDQIELGETVQFKSGSASVAPESFGLIAEIARAIGSVPADKMIVVEGHTDDRGNKKANVALSEKRAQAVVAHLVRAGIARARLQAAGKGPNVPIAKNDTEEGRKKNRRVELHIVDAKQ